MRIAVATLLAFCFVVTGCQKEKEEAENQDVGTHIHSAKDKLHWAQKDLEVEGFVISLGHHGNHFHAKDPIEPAVMITKDGEPVADAKIKNSMLSEDGENVLVEAIDMVYEPATDHEPAHYAQGTLTIPDDTIKFVIRFEITLPGVDEPQVHEINVAGH